MAAIMTDWREGVLQRDEEQRVPIRIRAQTRGCRPPAQVDHHITFHASDGWNRVPRPSPHGASGKHQPFSGGKEFSRGNHSIRLTGAKWHTSLPITRCCVSMTGSARSAAMASRRSRPSIISSCNSAVRVLRRVGDLRLERLKPGRIWTGGQGIGFTPPGRGIRLCGRSAPQQTAETWLDLRAPYQRPLTATSIRSEFPLKRKRDHRGCCHDRHAPVSSAGCAGLSGRQQSAHTAFDAFASIQSAGGQLRGPEGDRRHRCPWRCATWISAPARWTPASSLSRPPHRRRLLRWLRATHRAAPGRSTSRRADRDLAKTARRRLSHRCKWPCSCARIADNSSGLQASRTVASTTRMGRRTPTTATTEVRIDAIGRHGQPRQSRHVGTLEPGGVVEPGRQETPRFHLHANDAGDDGHQEQGAQVAQALTIQPTYSSSWRTSNRHSPITTNTQVARATAAGRSRIRHRRPARWAASPPALRSAERGGASGVRHINATTNEASRAETPKLASVSTRERRKNVMASSSARPPCTDKASSSLSSARRACRARPRSMTARALPTALRVQRRQQFLGGAAGIKCRAAFTRINEGPTISRSRQHCLRYRRSSVVMSVV